MSFQYKVLAIILLVLLSFAMGRRSAKSVTIDTQTQTHEDTKTQDHKKTVITEQPNGIKTTVITDDIKSETVETQVQQTHEVVNAKKPVINVSALVGTDYTSLKPIYGMSVSKEFLGPVTIGVYGMTNHMIGLSLGIDF
jgi:hypothetical protein